MKLAIASLLLGSAVAFSPSAFSGSALKASTSNGSALDMKYKVAVVGGGPSGACAAEIFAKERNIDTVLIERKMNNAKPCGGAIPLCMIGEFDIPESTVDRKVGFLSICFVLVCGHDYDAGVSSLVRLARLAVIAIYASQLVAISSGGG